MFLEKNECDVAECKSAEEALSFLDKGIYDMVVSEYKLHGKDGLWLLNRISERISRNTSRSNVGLRRCNRCCASNERWGK